MSNGKMEYANRALVPENKALRGVNDNDLARNAEKYMRTDHERLSAKLAGLLRNMQKLNARENARTQQGGEC